MADAFIPSTDQYTIPKGLTATTTPQGGSAFKDAGGNMYLKGNGGYTLAPQTLPGQQATIPTPANSSVAAPTTVTPQSVAPVQVQPPVMPSGVKSALEATANAGGASVDTGTPMNPSKTAPTPTVDYSLHNGESVDQYNARIQQERDAAGTSSPSSKTPNINDFMGGVPPAPTVPDYNGDQTKEENSLGIPGMQSNIQDLTSQLQQAQNQVLTEASNEASKPGVVSSIINGRIVMVSAKDAVAIKDLNDRITTARQELTAANSVVSTFMKNEAQTYHDASTAYNDAYKNAISQYKDAVTQQDKEQVNAKANAQIIINSYKNSSAGINSITEDEKAQWSQLEMQAGMPPGTIQAAITAELNVQKFVKGSDGYTYVQGTDDNGNPYVAKVEGSGGSAPSPKTTQDKQKQLADDISQTNGYITDQIANDPKRKDNYLSPTEWGQLKQSWIAAGHTSAQFNAAFGQYKNPDKTQKYD